MVFSKKNPEEASDSLLFENPRKEKTKANILKICSTISITALWLIVPVVGLVTLLNAKMLYPYLNMVCLWVSSGVLTPAETFLACGALSHGTIAIAVCVGVAIMTLYFVSKTIEVLFSRNDEPKK